MLKTQNRVRYLNKQSNANERENYSKWWKEQIEHYGTSVTYYTHGYSLTSHNFLYGEDPTAEFRKADDLIMLTDITNDSLMLSKFGIMADCDMTAVIHISSFYDKFGCGTEPKAGDLIQLTEYGADRPGGRMAPIYEITERDDEYLPMTNPLVGHYVWYIKCKRFEYSYESGVPNGPNNKQPSDGGAYGIVPQDGFEPLPQPTAFPTHTPVPTRAPAPTRTPGPTRTPMATVLGTDPTPTPEPTETPYATETPYPTPTPYPTYTPLPTQVIPETLFQPYPDSVQNSAKCIYDYYDRRNAGLDRNLAYYVPPQVPTCETTTLTSFSQVPGPYSQQTTFTKQDAESLQNLAFLLSNKQNIVQRTSLQVDENNKEFTISTEGDADVIKYQTGASQAYEFVDLLRPTPSSTNVVPPATPEPTWTEVPTQTPSGTPYENIEFPPTPEATFVEEPEPTPTLPGPPPTPEPTYFE